jgi:DNA topoisomerase VI subunit B
VVNAALVLARPLIKSVRVKTELSHRLPAVQADSSKLERVLLNLILNALDAMPDGGELAVCTELVSGDAVAGAKNAEEKPFVLITVADTGIGIPENLLLSIFDPFLRPSRLARALAWDYRARNGSCASTMVISRCKARPGRERSSASTSRRTRRYTFARLDRPYRRNSPIIVETLPFHSQLGRWVMTPCFFGFQPIDLDENHILSILANSDFVSIRDNGRT